MPIIDDNDLSAAIANGSINAISIDTNIFDQKQLRLNSGTLSQLAELKARSFDFLLSSTVVREVQKHMVSEADEARRLADKGIRAALAAFDVKSPARDEILAIVTANKSASSISEDRMNEFLQESACTVIDDASLASLVDIHSAYFEEKPPFRAGAKKNEFPDAIALYALERQAKERGNGILVVSNDGDWEAYAETSDCLFLVKDIERALALIAGVPPAVKSTIMKLFAEGSVNRSAIEELVTPAIEAMDFYIDAHAMHGDVEAYAWTVELHSVVWPEGDEVDIIRYSPSDDSAYVTISIPLEVWVNVSIELNFYVWDSVDREYVSISERSVDVGTAVEVRASVGFRLDAESNLDEMETDFETSRQYIELGSIHPFEDSDLFGPIDK